MLVLVVFVSCSCNKTKKEVSADNNGGSDIKTEKNTLFGDGMTVLNQRGYGLGYIDKTGKFVIEPQYSKAQPFIDGKALVAKDGKAFFIDTNGNAVNDIKFDYKTINNLGDALYGNSVTRYFSDGMMPVCVDGKWGYINESCDIVVKPQYGYAGEFCEGRAVVKKGDKWGYIDASGKEVIKPKYMYANDFIYGVGGVNLNGNLIVIDKNGNRVIDSKCGQVVTLCDGFFVVKKDDKFGVVNEHSETVIPYKYDNYTACADGLVGLYEGDDCYVFDCKTGKKLSDTAYESVQPKENGIVYLFYKNGKVGCMNRSGKDITDGEYDKFTDKHRDYGDIIIVSKGFYFGAIDHDGNVVIDTVYDEISDFNCGLAFAKKDGKYGYIDKNGNCVIPFEYDGAHEFYDDGYACVKKADKEFVIDKEGNVVLKLNY